MKNPWVVIGVLAVVLIGGSIGYAQYVGTQANEGVEVRDHVKGNPDAEVVLVEYSDFECPTCAAFYPIVSDIMDMYGDEVRFEYRHFPVINRNPQILLAAEAAGQQDMFFEYHDLIFENHQLMQSGNVERVLQGFAEDLELDMDLWEQHRRAALLRSKIQDDFAQGNADGVTGTPTFFLNGEQVQVEALDDLTRAVEQAIGVDSTTQTPEDGIEVNIEDVETGTESEAIEVDLGEVEAGGEGEAELELEL